MSSAAKEMGQDSVKRDAPRLHTRWYEAHSIAGVYALIPLFIILVAGTISFFRGHLEAWHIPAFRIEAPETLTEIDHLIAEPLKEVPQDAANLRIDFPEKWSPLVQLRWMEEGSRERTVRALNPIDGSEVDNNAISSELADHLYHWHYLDPIPLGLQISGFIGLIWFALTVGGFYIHRKELLSQFKGWGDRKGRALQSWIHGFTATLTLPLHIIYGVTGAIFGLFTLALPIMLFLGFEGDQETMMENFSGKEPQAEFTENYVEALPPLDPFIVRTLEIVPGAQIINMFIEKPFDEGARMHVHFRDGTGYISEVKYDIHQSDEAVFIASKDSSTFSYKVIMTAFTLHFGNFGGLGVRILYAVGGILLSVLTYAGARHWVIRKERALPRGSKIFERFFDGFALGMFPAIGVFAWANRLLPAGIDDRGHVEILVFHWAWVIIGFAVVGLGTSRRVRRLLMVGAVMLLAAVPLLDGMIFGAWPWDASSWYVPSMGVTNLFLILCAVIWGAWAGWNGWRNSQRVSLREPESEPSLESGRRV